MLFIVSIADIDNGCDAFVVVVFQQGCPYKDTNAIAIAPFIMVSIVKTWIPLSLSICSDAKYMSNVECLQY